MRKRNIRKAAAALTALALCAGVLSGCGGAASSTASSAASSSAAASSEASGEDADEAAAKNVADLIDAIYVQERNDSTDEQCAAAKAAWDSLTDAQKELVEGENADPDYFGRATVDSPATLTVADGKMTATIAWSSPNYDYMVVDGEKYLPTNTEGNSTFEIPVAALGTPLAVTADTVAMSTPHEIEYTLTFTLE